MAPLFINDDLRASSLKVTKNKDMTLAKLQEMTGTPKYHIHHPLFIGQVVTSYRNMHQAFDHRIMDGLRFDQRRPTSVLASVIKVSPH